MRRTRRITLDKCLFIQTIAVYQKNHTIIKSNSKKKKTFF